VRPSSRGKTDPACPAARVGARADLANPRTTLVEDHERGTDCTPIWQPIVGDCISSKGTILGFALELPPTHHSGTWSCGPHHSAANSTSTVSSLSTTSCSKCRRWTVGRGMAVSLEDVPRRDREVRRKRPYGARRPAVKVELCHARRRNSAVQYYVEPSPEPSSSNAGETCSGFGGSPTGPPTWRASAGGRNAFLRDIRIERLIQSTLNDSLTNSGRVPPTRLLRKNRPAGCPQAMGTDSWDSASVARLTLAAQSQGLLQAPQDAQSTTELEVLLVPSQGPRPRDRRHDPPNQQVKRSAQSNTRWPLAAICAKGVISDQERPPP